MEKVSLDTRPSDRLLLKDDTGGDPTQPPACGTSRVSFYSRLPVRQPRRPARSAPGNTSSRYSRLQQSAGSHGSSTRLVRDPALRSHDGNSVQLPSPPNTASRGQFYRLKSRVACSGRDGLAPLSAEPSTPLSPASMEKEPLFVDRSTQTEPPAPERSGAAERTDRFTQTESPVPERWDSLVPVVVEREVKTERPVTLPRAAPAAPRDPKRPRRRQRLSLFRRLLRACCGYCTRAQHEQLDAEWA